MELAVLTGVKVGVGETSKVKVAKVPAYSRWTVKEEKGAGALVAKTAATAVTRVLNHAILKETTTKILQSTLHAFKNTGEASNHATNMLHGKKLFNSRGVLKPPTFNGAGVSMYTTLGVWWLCNLCCAGYQCGVNIC